MAEAPRNRNRDQPPANVDIDPDFEPQKRPRSCTWPLPHPESRAGKPAATDADVIPEEEDDEGERADSGVAQAAEEPRGCSRVPPPAETPLQMFQGRSERRRLSGNVSSRTIPGSAERRGGAAAARWRCSSSSGSFALTHKGFSVFSSQNSIRHNLSLHSRFVKVQNEGTGKSSWWVVNPEGGKGGKAPRRRAVSMDNSKYMKGARGRATKKKASLQAAQDGSSESSSSLSKWTGSPSSDELDAWTDFRSRTNSNASTLSGRLSPILANLDPSSMSPSTGPTGLSDLAGTMNLNDGLSDNLMDDLLDNISLTASQQPPPGEEDAGAQGGSVFTFSCPGGGLGSPPGTYGASPLFSPPTMTSLFAPAFGDHQSLLDPPGHSNVLLTQSDPLMSQASAAMALQNSRRNAMLFRKDPLQVSHDGAAQSAAPWQAGSSPPDGEGRRLDAKQLKSPSKLSSGLPAADLDLDVFNGSLECDMDAIIRNELMDADCLDLSFDTRLGPAHNRNSGSFPGSKQSWVPS
uniref:Fork-head domain-containing protein n=1 Tax=Oryzias melastigma TaxID=30732 RepID=A0A3B3E1Q9_ORYME